MTVWQNKERITNSFATAIKTILPIIKEEQAFCVVSRDVSCRVLLLGCDCYCLHDAGMWAYAEMLPFGELSSS